MDEWFAAVLEEYKTLREEALGAIEQMQRALQIGLVALGFITGFGVDVAESGVAVQVGLVCGPPSLAALILVLSFEEYWRAVVAGAHVAVLEQRVAHYLHTSPGGKRAVDGLGPPLTWETRIARTAQPLGVRRTLAVRAAVLLGATFPAVSLGLFRLGDAGHWGWFAGSVVGVIIVVLLISLYIWSTERVMTAVQSAALTEMPVPPRVPGHESPAGTP
jgi:hypothetical protein